MAHIPLPEGLPGILGPMAFRPEMTRPLYEFMEVLMRGENSLSRGERELIAAYVSAQNDCFFCQEAHGATAQHYLQCDMIFVDKVKTDFQSTALSDKIKALLTIAGSVQKGGKNVTSAQVEQAKNHGASDFEIHDTVLIAAAFSMFNRYVDGLDTWAPQERSFYTNRAKERAEQGYTKIRKLED
jgi:uncharacterized peroxidase-related enzyme